MATIYFNNRTFFNNNLHISTLKKKFWQLAYFCLLLVLF